MIPHLDLRRFKPLPKGLGQVPNPDAPMPLPTPAAMRRVAHARCVVHVRKVEGCREPVCVLPGQSTDEVLAIVSDLV